MKYLSNLGVYLSVRIGKGKETSIIVDELPTQNNPEDQFAISSSSLDNYDLTSILLSKPYSQRRKDCNFIILIMITQF